MLVTFALFGYLAVVNPGADSVNRPTAFFSELVNKNIVYGYNHFGYVMLMFILVLEGFGSLNALDVDS